MPIIEVGTSQHPKPRELLPKPRELHVINQARDAEMGTKEKQRVETKPNAATWKRLERKKAGMEKGKERVVAKVGGKRDYSDHNQDIEATWTSENKKKKIQDAIPNTFSTAKAASRPCREQ